MFIMLQAYFVSDLFEKKRPVIGRNNDKDLKEVNDGTNSHSNHGINMSQN